MKLDERLLDLCLDVFVVRLAADDHLPEAERRKLARAAAQRVRASGAPAVVAWLEKQRPRTVVDEMLAARVRARARPHIEAVLARANLVGDVTERMLIGDDDRKPSGLWWVAEHRDELCWLLIAQEGLTTYEVPLVVRMTRQAVSVAMGRHEKRQRAAAAGAEQKEQVG